MAEAMEGVGWISQVQLPDGGWVSWTQWKQREAATKHALRLLENDSSHLAARVVRVDWTVVDTFELVSAEEQAHLEREHGAAKQAGLEEEGEPGG